MRLASLITAGFIAVFGAHAPAALADSKGAESYKWVDANGTLHYGDRVPVDATNRDRAVLNSAGVPVKQLDGQKSAEQLAAEARSQAETAHQRQHDVFLLTTYASAKEIEQLRDLRLDQMEGQLRAGWLYVDTLEERLRSLQARAFFFLPYSNRPGARKMPDDLAEDLVRTLNEARVQRSSLEAKQVEKEKVRQQFDADVARYHAIKIVRASP